MTEEVRPSQGPYVLETTDEKDSGAVTASLIDPRFLEDKEAKCNRWQHNVGDVFLAASYVSLLLDLCCSVYTLWCASHPQSDLTLFRVSVVFFSLYLFMSAVFLTNSAIELRDLSTRDRKLTEKEKLVKYATELLSAITGALFMVLCSLAIVMACHIHNGLLQYSSLVLSLVAPFMCLPSAFLRVYDTYLAYRKERDLIDALEASGEQTVTPAQKAAADRRAQSHFIRASLYGVISIVVVLDFVVAIWEAYILVGNTHMSFYITEEAFLISQVVLATVFLVLAVVERVLKNTTEPDLAEGQVESLADQQPSVSADNPSYANDDTSPFISHHCSGEVSVAPCLQKALVLE
ncbi:hypothetical protein [Anaplasma bovis]|uniref:hypothetical protein n=1 Tax=Anaplasma bovis TaxID=186733 RepID=UPI002FEE8561